MKNNSAYFKPAFFQFFRELKSNNRREWFQANKTRFESEVRDPMIHFISDFAPHLRAISKHYYADPRPVGGSMFRIYRDVRFSKGQKPLQDPRGHVLSSRRRPRKRNLHSRILSSSFTRTRFSSARDYGIRRVTTWQNQKLDSDASGAMEAGDVATGISRDLPSRPATSCNGRPKGYDPEHPLIEDLKRKDFVTITDLSEKQACAAAFMDAFVASSKAAAPFMRFLTESLGLPW